MTAARGVALGALVLAVAVVAVLLLRGPGGTTYKLRFENAGQLVKDDDVQVGGRRIGSIRKIALTDNNQAEITIKVQGPYAPLHEGTTALIRATSLSGIANRYIALTPGPNSNPKLPEGATLRNRQDDVDRRPRPALQHAGPQDAQGAAGRHPGQRGVVRQSRRRRPTRPPSTSTPR